MSKRYLYRKISIPKSKKWRFLFFLGLLLYFIPTQCCILPVVNLSFEHVILVSVQLFRIPGDLGFILAVLSLVKSWKK